MADGYIRIDTQLNTSGLTQGVGKVNSLLGKITASAGQVASTLGVAFGVSKIKEFATGCVEAAASVKAANSQFEQTFGSLADSAEAAIDRVASASGILDTRLQSTGTSIYAFAKTTGMESAEALGLMERALTVTADQAAYYDRSLEDVAESLQSFLKGNYENDAALGLSCTETTRNTAANKLYGKSFSELSEAQKQLTLLQMVEDANELSGALGQASRESEGWENVTGNLTESMRQFMAVVGEPALAAAVPAVQWLTQGMEQLTSAVQDGYESIAEWAGTVNFTPLIKSAGKLWSALKELFSGASKYIKSLSSLAKPLLEWLIEVALPTAITLISNTISLIGKIYSAVSPVINFIASGISTIIDGVKAAIVAVSRLFGLEPPAWALESTDLSISSGLGDTASDAADDYSDLADAAGEAADAIEDAEDAGDTGSGGSGGGSGSGSSTQRDILGFDQITKLSAQASSGGSGSGSSGGSGGSSGSSGGTSTASNPASAYTDPEIQSGVEQMGESIDGLKIEFDDLNVSIETATRSIQELAKDRSASITLNLKKGPKWDDLKAQWDAIRSEQVVKRMTATLEASVRTSMEQLVTQHVTQVITAVLAPGQAPLTLQCDCQCGSSDSSGSKGRGGGFGGGNGGGFSDSGRGGTFGGGNGGGFSSKSSTSILDTVKKWWNSLKKGKATKTLDLRGGTFQGSGGGFSKGIKQWESLKNGKATKTIGGKTTSGYRSAVKSWESFQDSTVTKTTKATSTSTYKSVQKSWSAWTSGTITKTASATSTSTYKSVQKDWTAWKNGTITKTASGSTASTYTSVKRDWSSWTSGSITKTTKGDRGSTYTSVKSDWSGWKSATVTKTVAASPDRKFKSVKSDWDSLKDKKVTGNIAMKATVSNIKTWLNSNVITPLNKAIHVIFPKISIPKLARGGVVNQATMALVGEAGREAVLPLERNTGWMDELAGRLAQQMGGSSAPSVVEVYVGNELLATKVVQAVNDTTRRTGRCPIRV